MFLEIRSSLFYCITVSLVFCFGLFYFIPFLFCSCTKTKSYFFCFSKTKSFFFAISFFTGRDNQSCSSTRRAIWRIWVPSHLNKTKTKKLFLLFCRPKFSYFFHSALRSSKPFIVRFNCTQNVFHSQYVFFSCNIAMLNIINSFVRSFDFITHVKNLEKLLSHS